MLFRSAALEALVSSTPENAGIHRAGSTSTVRGGTSPNPTMAYQGPPPANGSAIVDEKPAKSKPGPKSNKARRASEGAYLSKSERKRTSGDIRCETCGKGYKHSSCLTKHLLVVPLPYPASIPAMSPLLPLLTTS